MATFGGSCQPSKSALDAASPFNVAVGESSTRRQSREQIPAVDEKSGALRNLLLQRKQQAGVSANLIARGGSSKNLFKV